MALSLLELAANIVSSHASVTEMSTEDLLSEIEKVHAALQKIEGGSEEVALVPEQQKFQAMSLKKAFQADQVYCMVCGKGGMKTLARHLAQAHNMKPGEYKRQFNVPKEQPLTAKNFSENRKKMAKERGLAENLAKARAVRAAKIKAEKSAQSKAGKSRAKKA